ncbi:MAG: oligosaccharide flippase family protein [Thermoleophilia bacterium]
MARFKTVVKYSSYLFGTKILTRVMYTAFVVFAAAHLGSELFGIFAFSMAMTELLSWLGELGLTQFGAREMIKADEQDRPALNSQFLLLQILTSVALCLVGLVIILAWRPEQPKMMLLLMGLGAVLLSGVVNATESILIASKNFLYSSLFSLTGRVIFMTIGFFAVAKNMSVTVIMAGYLIAVMVESLLRMVVIASRIVGFSARIHLSQTWRLFRASLPFATVALASVLYSQAAIVAIEIFKGDAAVGVYSVAYSLFVPFVWVAQTLAKTTFPTLAETYKENTDDSRRYFQQWYRLLVMAGIPLAVGTTLLAGTLASYMPEGFSSGKLVLILLMWMVPSILISPLELSMLQIIGLEGVGARIIVVSMVATIGLQLIFVPIFGVTGAAIALLLGAVLREIQYYEAIRRNFLKKKHFLILWSRPVIAGAVMFLVAFLTWWLGPWVASVLGAFGYVGSLFAMRALSISEIRNLARS